MGCCRSKHESDDETAIDTGNSSRISRISRKESRNIVEFDEEDIRQPAVSEWPSIDHESRSNVERLVYEVLEVIRRLTERFV